MTAPAQARPMDQRPQDAKVIRIPEKPSGPTASQIDAHRKFVGGGSRFGFVKSLAP